MEEVAGRVYKTVLGRYMLDSERCFYFSFCNMLAGGNWPQAMQDLYSVFYLLRKEVNALAGSAPSV